MKAPVLERTSAAKSGWVIILLTIGWLAFLLWPDKAEKKAAQTAAIPMPSSSLTRAGLRDYTDWEGLPEIFAIWADKAEWKDGKTRFAYWHPVMKSYSYFFEATRVGKGYRFREIPEPNDANYMWESMGDDCPIRFYRSPPPINRVPDSLLLNPASNDRPKLKLDIAAPKVQLPKASAPAINPASKP